MKIATKIISLCLIVSMMLGVFVACAPSKEDVIGTYIGDYNYNDDTYAVVITLSDDGKYVKTKTKNSGIPSIETGDYEIDGEKVCLYDSKSETHHGKCTVYNYKRNTLENNNHKFVKN